MCEISRTAIFVSVTPQIDFILINITFGINEVIFYKTFLPLRSPSICFQDGIFTWNNWNQQLDLSYK